LFPADAFADDAATANYPHPAGFRPVFVPAGLLPVCTLRGNKGGRVRQAKTSHLAISLEPAQVADSLCCGQETRMMRKHEIQIENSNSKSSNKFKN
jgi:hypothetical protein